jgi:S1-C subfamily serine protease
LLLVSVKSGSPAERAGLLLRDAIVGLDNQPVPRMDDLAALLGGDRVGSSVLVRIVRSGQMQQLTLVIDERT